MDEPGFCKRCNGYGTTTMGVESYTCDRCEGTGLELLQVKVQGPHRDAIGDFSRWSAEAIVRTQLFPVTGPRSRLSAGAVSLSALCNLHGFARERVGIEKLDPELRGPASGCSPLRWTEPIPAGARWDDAKADPIGDILRCRDGILDTQRKAQARRRLEECGVQLRSRGGKTAGHAINEAFMRLDQLAMKDPIIYELLRRRRRFEHPSNIGEVLDLAVTAAEMLSRARADKLRAEQIRAASSTKGVPEIERFYVEAEAMGFDRIQATRVLREVQIARPCATMHERLEAAKNQLRGKVGPGRKA